MGTVTKIPATKLRVTSNPAASQHKRRVAAYARVSTDSDEQFTSYEAQIDYYTHYIKAREDWEFAGVYTDEGITGTSTKNREGFKKMVADALAGKIDLIVTKSVSRFARNTVDSLTTIRQLKEHGTECFFEKENIWTFDGKGELLITIMSSLAQEESRSISQNCTWGQRKRMADGRVSIPFSSFLGYKRGPNGEMVIDEDEAKVVRDIYAWFLQGLTPNTIAKRLTEMRIPTPRGKEMWRPATVQSILTNEKYKGDALMQKYYSQDYLTKKIVVNEGVLPQYYVENDHEAIIPPETFELVQQEFERRKAQTVRYSGVDIFASHIVCGQCGGFYGGKIWHSNDPKYRKKIYRCNTKYAERGVAATNCTTPHLTEDEIERAFNRAVNKLLTRKKSVIDALMSSSEQVFDTGELEAERDKLADEMAQLSDKMQAAVNENARVALDQHEYELRYGELAELYGSAKAQHDAVVKTIADKVSAKKASQTFISTLQHLSHPIQNFDVDIWGALLDHMTVYSKDDIRVTFRDGTEIQT